MIVGIVLIWVLIAEGTVLTGSVLIILGHAFWTRWHKSRSAHLITRARQIAMEALENSSLPSRDIEFLQTVSPRLQIRIFSELASNVGGTQRNALTTIAHDLGLVSRAEQLCRSYWWWKRLYGARLFAMFGAGHEVLPSLLQDRSPWVRVQAAEWAADHPTPLNLCFPY